MPSTHTRVARNAGEVRLLHVADLHIAPQSPPSWKIDFLEQTEATLKQVFDFGLKREVDAVIWSGDIFHRKSPASNPLHFMSRVIRLFRLLEDAGVENWGIGGNHDLKWGSLEGLEGQPLENLIAANVFRLLDEKELLIKSTGFEVRVAGGSYHHGVAEHVRGKSKQGANYLVSLGHFWFGRESGEFLGEPVFGPDYLGSGEPDIYCIGHHHEDQGVQLVNGKWYVVHGSINRTGGREHDLIRKPAAALIVIKQDGIEVKVLRPKVKEASEVIDFTVRAQIMEEKKDLEDFIETLHTAKIEAADPKDVLSELEAAQEVKVRAGLYLDQAEETLARVN